MNGSNVWGSFAPYGDVLPFFKWNIFTKEGVLSLQTVIIDDSLQITLGKKKIAKCHLECSYLFICIATGIILHFMELVNFSHKYSI